MPSQSNENYIEWQAKVTKALLKFCLDHHYPDSGLDEIRECLKSLKRRDIKAALASYQKVPLGGRMGYFDDWAPPVVSADETPEYLQVVFQSLLNEWDRVMRLSLIGA